MSQDDGTVGDVVFGGSRFIFWALAPLLLISGITTPFLLDDWNPTKIIVTAAWCVCSLLAIPAIYDARSFWWAARGVTGIIFLAYLAYVVDEFFLDDGDDTFTGARSETNPLNAVLGLAIIGLPCLWYTLLGRFRLRPIEEYVPEFDDVDEMDEP